MSFWVSGYVILIALVAVAAIWLVYLLFGRKLASTRRHGAWVGCIVGFTAALAYTLLWTVTVGVAYLATSDDYAGIGELVQMHVAFLLNAFWFGLAPATLCGGFTGWLIERSMRPRFSTLSATGAMRIGAIVCITCILGWHLVVLQANIWLSDSGNPFIALSSLFYLLFIGLPSLIYLMIGLRWSFILWQRINKTDGIVFHSITGLTSPLETDILV